MRVALFTETFLPKLDGIVRVVCLLLDHLKARGIDVLIVAPRLGDQESPLTDYRGFEVLTVPGLTFPLYPELRVGPPTFHVFRKLEMFNPDVVHLIHPLMIGIPGLMMAKWLGVPTLASFHIDMSRMAEHHQVGFVRGALELMTRTVFNLADYSLAPSNLILREMQALGVREVGLWKRGVDAEKFNPRYYNDAMRHELSDGHPQAPLMLYVGRLSAEKQVGQLRAALERVPGVRLAIVGDGPERAELEAHFKGTATKFMGYLQGERLSQAYASADMFVFPSALETFGLVVTEAMAAGLSVVASRVGGIPDVVQEGQTGYTFEVGDVDAMVAGVRAIASSRATIARMGQAARAYAETQTWDHMMDEVIDHYRRLIDLYAQAAQASA